jgi:hypothetical protein
VRGAIVLIGAGAVALVMSRLDWARLEFLALFGASDGLVGPFGLPMEWLDRLPDVAAMLGAVAIVSGAIALRRASRPLAAATALVLAAGTAYLVAWLVDPPESLVDDSGGFIAVGDTIYMWATYVATAALAVATIAAVWLTRPGAATGARRRRPAPAGLPRPHSPTPPR